MNEPARAALPLIALPPIALGLLLLPAEAPAQTFESGPYIGASAGALFLSDNEGSVGGIDTGVEFDTGYNLALQLGYRFSVLRAELEAEYGEAGVDAVGVGGASIDPDFDFRYVRGTAGLYADLTLLPLLTPYVGGGAGVAYIHGDSADVGGIEVELESDAYLTAHGEIGLALDVLPYVSIVPAYRYIWIDTDQGEVEDTTAHVVKLGARLEF